MTKKFLTEKIECMICGRKYTGTIGSHILFVHNVRAREYRTRYPDAKMHTEEFKQHQKRQVLLSHKVWHENTGYWPDWSKDEMIHHKDGDHFNNDFKNLQLMTNSEHLSLHNSGEGHPLWQGDSAHVHAKYLRYRRDPNKHPPLTEEEQEQLRAYWKERNRKRRLKS